MSEYTSTFHKQWLAGSKKDGSARKDSNKRVFRDADAQYSLGVMHAQGQGITQDSTRAHMWFNIAGSQGLEKAIEARGFAEDVMTPSQIEKAQELALIYESKGSLATDEDM
ncbi:MAG: SEL1-like repeat protein, partial [bacterium]